MQRHALSMVLLVLLCFPALAVQAQTLLWEEQIDLGTPETLTEFATARRRVFLTAHSATPDGNRWAVYVWNQHGRLLWQEDRRAPAVGGVTPLARPLALATREETLAVVGTFGGWTVRLYDAETGAVQWTDAGSSGAAHTVALSPEHVYVGGTRNGRGLLRAYTLDGAVRWERQDGTPGMVYQSVHVQTRRGGERVIAVHKTGHVQAVRGATGDVLWTRAPQPETRITAAALEGNQLVLVGTRAGAWFVQVRSRDTGRTLWQVREPGEIATTLAIRAHIYVGGGTLGDNARTVVRAYDRVSGMQVWEAVGAAEAGGQSGANVVRGLTLDISTQLPLTRLYASSAMVDAAAGDVFPDFFIQRYAAATGTPGESIRVDGSAHLWDSARRVLGASQRLYVAGFVNRATSLPQREGILVQAYRPAGD